MEPSKRRDRWSYTPEFETEIVGRCRAGDRSIAEVARDFDLTAWQYFPKGVSVAGITQEQLDLVAHKLNARPRKTLGYATSAATLVPVALNP
jgi:transposase-like protein